MTLDELKEKKETLETEILELVQDFENETRLMLLDIKLMTVLKGLPAYSYTVSIKTEVKL